MQTCVLQPIERRGERGSLRPCVGRPGGARAGRGEPV
jgi:hypothetical protein